MVAAVAGAEVQGDQITKLDGAAGGHVVRDGTVWPARDDRFEAGLVGAKLHHAPLERDRELPFRAARADRQQRLVERLAGERARGRDDGDFFLVFDHAQRFHGPAERNELDFPGA